MLEVQVNEVKEIDSKENGEIETSRGTFELSSNIMSNLLHIAVTPLDIHPSMTNVPASVSDEEYNIYKLMFGNGKYLIVVLLFVHFF